MLTSDEVCDLAGCSYRQLDVWLRQGIISSTVPARGSGSRRAFTDDDLRCVIMVTRLAELGCPWKVSREAARMMWGHPADDWTGYLLVYADGDIVRDDRVKGAALVVDLASCRTRTLADAAA